MLLLPEHTLGAWAPALGALPVPSRSCTPGSPHPSHSSSCKPGECQIPAITLLAGTDSGVGGEELSKGRFDTEPHFGCAVPAAPTSRGTPGTPEGNSITRRGDPSTAPASSPLQARQAREKSSAGGVAEAGGKCEAVMFEVWASLLLTLLRLRPHSSLGAALPLSFLSFSQSRVPWGLQVFTALSDWFPV